MNRGVITECIIMGLRAGGGILVFRSSVMRVKNVLVKPLYVYYKYCEYSREAATFINKRKN